jgi:hypothetical protein
MHRFAASVLDFLQKVAAGCRAAANYPRGAGASFSARDFARAGQTNRGYFRRRTARTRVL